MYCLDEHPIPQLLYALEHDHVWPSVMCRQLYSGLHPALRQCQMGRVHTEVCQRAACKVHIPHLLFSLPADDEVCVLLCFKCLRTYLLFICLGRQPLMQTRPIDDYHLPSYCRYAMMICIYYNKSVTALS